MAIVLKTNAVKVDESKRLEYMRFEVTFASNGMTADAGVYVEDYNRKASIVFERGRKCDATLENARKRISQLLEHAHETTGYHVLPRGPVKQIGPYLFEQDVTIPVKVNGIVLTAYEQIATDPDVIAAFEKRYREKYSHRFVSVEAQFDKRNGEYIDGEVSECFEYFCEGWLIAKGKNDQRFKEFVEGLKT